ncbi:hypothetical protein CSTERLE_04895 [Thermoclostridium stercorarium subsp. leptospartum DSM 9219]|jgi:hypothetical protein|uniref:Uncharacterized protein n=1 Tax=Thermoclostridium stercorarium subsp. leptospartum DSM 9219 TaxID=1346611 RepID=A0A1B1YJK6_THEST|nr:hypothetical protein [Thermoclostridium stercorarium]ANX00969.1 hypothetical protein CSTERLE_04895 [Thermoclostridium stercorarium subsp. leptospartum DSM 9219]
MIEVDLKLVKKYVPNIYFDENEPFYPRRIGCTVFTRPGPSPSFRREIMFNTDEIKYVIEYAMYWDFDIQHLYELEHVWVYVAHNGQVADCEASFHGKYLKGLLKDRSNIEDETHVKLYSQPGKHAFSPIAQVFELLPDFETATFENAGNNGLLITSVLEGRYSTNDEINGIVSRYLKKFRFRPSMKYKRYEFGDDVFTDWETLHEEIPKFIQLKLDEIRNG